MLLGLGAYRWNDDGATPLSCMWSDGLRQTAFTPIEMSNAAPVAAHIYRTPPRPPARSIQAGDLLLVCQ